MTSGSPHVDRLLVVAAVAPQVDCRQPERRRGAQDVKAAPETVILVVHARPDRRGRPPVAALGLLSGHHAARQRLKCAVGKDVEREVHELVAHRAVADHQQRLAAAAQALKLRGHVAREVSVLVDRQPLHVLGERAHWPRLRLEHAAVRAVPARAGVDEARLAAEAEARRGEVG
eukprot:1150671-Prymnesium_polylepis.1